MDRSRITELHSIQHVANLESIVARGILSNKQVRSLTIGSRSVANEAVQAIRETKPVLGGRTVHDYACLFFNARTPMMYAIRERHTELAVLSVSPNVLDLPNVVIANGNASKTGTRFGAATTMLPLLDERLVFARYWTDPDPAVQDGLGRIRSAEVLIPDRVPPEYIVGCYVSCVETKSHVDRMGLPFGATLNIDVYFR